MRGGEEYMEENNGEGEREWGGGIEWRREVGCNNDYCELQGNWLTNAIKESFTTGT